MTRPQSGCLNATQRFSNSLLGAELNGVWALPQAGAWRLDVIGGFRFLRLRESLSLTTESPYIPPFPADIWITNDTFDTSNHFYGGQIGLRARMAQDAWFVDGSAKLALGAMVQKVDFPQAAADCVAALHRLEELPEVSAGVGVIGFCFGGTIAYLVAAIADPACLVSYYGSGVPGMLEQLDNIECPALFHFGDVDSYIPKDQVDSVVAAVAGRDGISVNIEHAGHAFDNHESAMFYDEAAATAAWPKTVAFLQEHLPV